MVRTNNFLRDQRELSVVAVTPQVDIHEPLQHSSHSRALGFQVPEDIAPRKAKRKARAEDFALLLADDAEKNFDKMIPLTKERMDRALALLEGVELD
jgi:hypothetical protein